jgi:electron transfer flavoprotein alpha subunit
MSILVMLEHHSGAWRSASLEALAAGQQLGRELSKPVSAVIAGHKLAALTSDAAAKKLDAVHVVDHELLADYTADGYTTALGALIRHVKPDLILFPHTYQVRDYAPKLATQFGRAFVGDVVRWSVSDNVPVFVRQVFQGKLLADIRLTSPAPWFVSLQTGAFRAEQLEAGAAEIRDFVPEIDASAIRAKPGEAFREAEGTVDLAAAERIVAAGRGIANEGDLEMLKDLARGLGAEVAASRPVCDNGWLPMDRQVGSSGQTVAPKLYVAVGVSGAIQHLVGMKGSKTIVAINRDPDAPIFEVADYGIVGDLYEIVPALVEELNKPAS